MVVSNNDRILFHKITFSKRSSLVITRGVKIKLSHGRSKRTPRRYCASYVKAILFFKLDFNEYFCTKYRSEFYSEVIFIELKFKNEISNNGRKKNYLNVFAKNRRNGDNYGSYSNITIKFTFKSIHFYYRVK